MIEAEKADPDSTMTISRMCALLGVAVDLIAQIRAFHAAFYGTYGAPRIHADLQDSGVVVSRKTVAKLMRADGITGISPRTWHPPTTVRGEDPFPVADLVERHFDQGERDMAWFSDITYLHTGEGWAYLCVVRDGNTRRVLGRTVGDSLHTDLVEDAPPSGRRAARSPAAKGDHPRRPWHPVHQCAAREGGEGARRAPVDGTHRGVLGQCGRGIVLVNVQERVLLPAHLRHHRRRPPRRLHLDRRLVQRPPPPLQHRLPQPSLRASPWHGGFSSEVQRGVAGLKSAIPSVMFEIVSWLRSTPSVDTR